MQKSTNNLYGAHHQWAFRPSDETFDSVEEAEWFLTSIMQRSAERSGHVNAFRAEVDQGDIVITGKQDVPATLTHHGFGQLAQVVKAPASYLRSLPPTLAVQNLNHGLKNAEKETRMLLLKDGGRWLARSFTSEKYARIWNAELAKAALTLKGKGWHTPPARPSPSRSNDPRIRPATAADVAANPRAGISIGDPIGPSGIFASDHDCFFFLVDDRKTIDVDGETQLSRGVFLQNSEVGQSSFRVTKFLYDYACGNHICWGVSNVVELRIRHVGETAWARAMASLKSFGEKYSAASAAEDEQAIRDFKRKVFGKTIDAAIETVSELSTAKKVQGLTMPVITAAFDIAAKTPRYGDPRTVWAFVNGLTEYSQRTTYTDERVMLDRAAGRILTLAA